MLLSKRSRRAMHRSLAGVLVMIILPALALACAEDESSGAAGSAPTSEKLEAREQRRADSGADFESQGARPGEKLGSLTVLSMDGEERNLGELWQDKPTLVVTASLTCGRSRERQEWVEKLAQKYGDELNVAVLYTVEAHPELDPSPYAKYSPELEDPTRPGERPGGNAKVGLSRRQPTTLEGRRELANEFEDLLDVNVPILLDGMDNTAWERFGGGPNVGLLVTSDGTVEVKHGWFDGVTMERSIEYFLEQQKSEKKED